MQQIIHPARKIKGEIQVPGDKSISHRSIMLGSIAPGTTEIINFPKNADCLATMDCFQRMGIEIEKCSDRILVHGQGLHGLKAPSDILNAGNSGTTARLLSGILAGQNFSSIISGDASLNCRPMERIITPLSLMGAHVQSIHADGCAPLKITPGALHGICYHSPIASAQVKSALLLAGLYADGETFVTEPSLSRDHTERMLQNFGVSVTVTENSSIILTPCKELLAQKIQIPGDLSSAAYFIAAALLIPNSELLIKNVGINPTRAGFLTVCKNMGANITIFHKISKDRELRADLLIKTSELKGTVIEGNILPTLIDEIPILAVIASLAEGATVIKDAAELKVKETNRIDTVTANLKAMGADVAPTEDGMMIKGSSHLNGTHIPSYFDHRIAMAFAIAGLTASGETVIKDSQCVDVSYPNFFETLGRITNA